MSLFLVGKMLGGQLFNNIVLDYLDLLSPSGTGELRVSFGWLWRTRRLIVIAEDTKKGKGGGDFVLCYPLDLNQGYFFRCQASCVLRNGSLSND